MHGMGTDWYKEAEIVLQICMPYRFNYSVSVGRNNKKRRDREMDYKAYKL